LFPLAAAGADCKIEVLFLGQAIDPSLVAVGQPVAVERRLCAKVASACV
jgi:hypothetical protein